MKKDGYFQAADEQIPLRDNEKKRRGKNKKQNNCQLPKKLAKREKFQIEERKKAQFNKDTTSTVPKAQTIHKIEERSQLSPQTTKREEKGGEITP